MTIHRMKIEKGVEPHKWKVEKYADVGDSEEFVHQMGEFPSVVNAGTIGGEQRERVNEAIISILMDGLIPAFLELRQIRESVNNDIPLLDRYLLYEDFARKLWKSYKQLMRDAVRLMGFDIGFLFDSEGEFRKGLEGFRELHPDLRKGFEQFLEANRTNWQNDLAEFRNTWVEHQTGDRDRFKKFYTPVYAEALFDAVWRTIADILPPLLELRLPHGIRLVEQHPNDAGPRWPQRFRYDHPMFRNMK